MDPEDFEMDFETDTGLEGSELPQDGATLPQEGGGATDEKPPFDPGQFVSRADYEKAMQDLAEMRGRMAAFSDRPTQQVIEQPKQQDNSGLEAALKNRLKSISAKMYDPDTADEGLREFLELNAQIAAAQAKQYVSESTTPAINTVADVIIENYMGRQEKNDELYDEVAPLVEAELAKVDKAAVARMPREQLKAAMDTLYKSKRADVLDAKWRAGKERAAERRRQMQSAPPNLGGGKGGTMPPVGGDARKAKIDEAGRKMALAMGFGEDELTDLFKEDGEDEW